MYLEPRERVEFDLARLLAGGDGTARHREWVVHAAHLAQPVVVDPQALKCLGSLSAEEWVSPETLATWPGGVLGRLLEQGLVIAEDDGTAEHTARDGQVRDGHWWGPAAVFHRAGRWKGEDAAAATEAAGLSTAVGLRTRLGVPPPATVEHCKAADRIPLERVESDAGFDELLQRRATCRNFDVQRPLPQSLLARMMERVFAAHGQWRMDDETVFLKKGSPSGGGLHPTEAYLIVQRVEGLQPGLYHYHPLDHALEPMPAPDESMHELALKAVAGQHWFADAPVLVVMAARFVRCFWKYRRHPKAYRAIVMDAGHLSQTLYLGATDLGLGAFVTCAINEEGIEQAFGLDGLEEGVMAVCGFGWRGDTMRNAEFDPGGKVWPESSTS